MNKFRPEAIHNYVILRTFIHELMVYHLQNEIYRMGLHIVRYGKCISGDKINENKWI